MVNTNSFLIIKVTMKINKPILIALLLMTTHGLALAQKAVRGICDGHPGCPKSGIANQQNNTNSNSSAERAQQVLKAIGAIGAAMERSTEAAVENERTTVPHQQLTHGNAQSDACPASIMAGGSSFDLAGAIAQAGSARALLARTEQALREMSTQNCSEFSNAEECRFTKAWTKDVNAALKKCIAVGTGNASGEYGNQQPSTTENCDRLFPKNEQINEKIACTSRVAQKNLSSADIAFNAIKSQPAPVVTENNPWTPVPFTLPDPKRDYSGQSCSYFTKPAREGDHRLNYYADDSFVCYGTTMYKCVARRWENKGPCSAYQDSSQFRAEKLESSTLNTKVYEE